MLFATCGYHHSREYDGRLEPHAADIFRAIQKVKYGSDFFDISMPLSLATATPRPQRSDPSDSYTRAKKKKKKKMGNKPFDV